MKILDLLRRPAQNYNIVKKEFILEAELQNNELTTDTAVEKKKKFSFKSNSKALFINDIIHKMRQFKNDSIKQQHLDQHEEVITMDSKVYEHDLTRMCFDNYAYGNANTTQFIEDKNYD
jgi:hypothetical protein